MILRRTDEIKEWPRTLEGALPDDGLHQVAVDDLVPFGRQSECRSVDELLHPVGTECGGGVVEASIDRVVDRGPVAFAREVFRKRVPDHRRQVLVRVKTLVPEQPRVDAGHHLELGHPAAAPDHVHSEWTDGSRRAAARPQRQVDALAQPEDVVRIEGRLA